jgi:hypothetical protein
VRTGINRESGLVVKHPPTCKNAGPESFSGARSANFTEAVGGPQTYVLGGAVNCGRAQPGQAAAVSHGWPSALFRNVNVLNTQQEAGR